MIYRDRVYERIEISEPLALDLIKSPSIQRLKGVDQTGYFEPYYPGTSFSRFEHSLGVFILLKRFGASVEEQISGLIHDVSHSVFSHCIDYALDEGSEKEHNHQDSIFESFVKKTEIPKILEKHRLDTDYILNEKNFPLEERKLPDLCADRIDYSLRTALIHGEIELEEAKYFLDNLITENNFWVFKNIEVAQRYANLFKKLNTVYFSGLASGIMFRTVGDFLKHALEKNYITKSDLFTTDEEVLKKIKQFLNKDEELKLLFDRMNNKIEFKNNPGDFNAHVFCKSRVIDPLCKHNGKTKRFSEVNRNWKKVIERESSPKEYFIRFVK